MTELAQRANSVGKKTLSEGFSAVWKPLCNSDVAKVSFVKWSPVEKKVGWFMGGERGLKFIHRLT